MKLTVRALAIMGFIICSATLEAQGLRVWLTNVDEKRSEISVESYLVNDSSDRVRVATKGGSGNPVVYTQADGSVRIVYFFRDAKDPEGRTVLRSDADCGVIEIGKHQAALLSLVKIQVPGLNLLKCEVSVEYSVDNEYAALHNVWAGVLHGKGKLPGLGMPSLTTEPTLENPAKGSAQIVWWPVLQITMLQAIACQ
jgi:hypothetical protein